MIVLETYKQLMQQKKQKKKTDRYEKLDSFQGYTAFCLETEQGTDS